MILLCWRLQLQQLLGRLFGWQEKANSNLACEAPLQLKRGRRLQSASAKRLDGDYGRMEFASKFIWWKSDLNGNANKRKQRRSAYSACRAQAKTAFASN